MRAERKRKSYSINLLLAFLGVQGVLLVLVPASAPALVLSSFTAIALGYLGFRRLDHPAPRPALPKVGPGLLQLLGHTPEELVGKTVIGATPVGVVFLRADGVMAEVNQRFAEMVGYGRAELIGRPVSEISLEQDLQENQTLIADAVSGRREHYQLESRYRRKDGGLVWVDAGATILRDENARFLYAVVVVVDITERKRTEQSLREGEQRFRALVASLREAILVRERDGTISACNPGAERIFGLPQVDIIGRSSLHPEVQYVNPDGTPFDVAQQPGNLALTSGHPADDVEFGIVRPDGTSRWVVASARPMFRDGERAPHAAVVSLIDISERRAAERELERQRTFLRTVLDAVPNLLAVRDREQRFVMVNRALADFYGTTPRQMIGMHHSTFIKDAQRAAAIQQSDAQLFSSGGVSGPEEKEVADAGGVPRWLQVAKRVIGDRAGEPNLVLVVGTDLTERKRLQEELQRAVEVRDTILENSFVGIVFLNQEGRAVWINRAAEQMFGVVRGELTGKSIEPFYLSRDDYLATGAAVADAVRAGRSYEAELRMRRSNGAVFRVQLSGKTVSPGQLSQGTVWVIADISERKRAEEQLRESEARFRSLTELSSDWYWEQDENLRFIDTSIGVLERSGMTRDERIGKTRWEVPSTGVTPEQWTAHRADLEARRPFRDFEVARLDGNGRTVHITTSGFPIFDAQGNFKGYRGVGRNITAGKLAELELKRQRHFLRQIIDSIPSIVFVRDRESRYTMCNRAHAEFCGLTPQQIIGRTSAEIGRSAAESELARRMDEMAFERGGRLEPFESAHRDVQGAVHWHENNKTVLYGADGVARQVLTVGTEITHRKEAEAQLQRMNEELERRVTERTAQLEASVKELEAFSYSVSHDLRAPLRAIDGYSQILIEEARGMLAPDARLCLDKISRNARRMAELIDRLLAFARYSRAPLERRPIDIAALVQSVIDEQPREAREIEFSVAPLRHCLADAQLLRHVFGNLVSNSVKYTRPREAARIEIGAFERDRATVYFVRDNGVGFDMRYVHKLFGVFQRLHSEKEFEGTGAGLAIVQRIVSRHGGRVWAEGEVGKGATFYFTLGSEVIAAAA